MTLLQRAEEIGSAGVGAFDVLLDRGGRLRVTQRLRVASRLCLYALRILGGSTMTMQREELLRLSEESYKLNRGEWLAGWHWCAEFDYDLVDPWSTPITFCTCRLSRRARVKRAIVRVVFYVRWDLLGGRQRALKDLERELL